MEKLNILIISRHIYPKQGPRSFRTTELALELARIGHKVTVYAMLGEYNYDEFSRINNIKIKSIGPNLSGLAHSDGTIQNNIIDKILKKCFHKLIDFPLIKLTWRIPVLLRKETNIDLLITIAFPHSIHWGTAVAKRINKNFPSKWISDCGDPYMGDNFNGKKFFYFKYIEKFWCNATDFITVPMKDAFSAYYPEFHFKMHVIPQGLDFTKIKISEENVQNKISTFAYAGSIYPKHRDPHIFFVYLISLNINFKFIVYTNNITYFTTYSNLLGDRMEIRPVIERNELIFEMSKVDFLINFKNNSDTQSPSKLIDYTLSRRPILSISTYFSTDEREKFIEFVSGNYKWADKEINIKEYNIIDVTNNFLRLYYENRNK